VLQGDGQVISHLTDLKVSGVGLLGMGSNIAKSKIVFQFAEGVFLATTARNKEEQLLSLPLFGICHGRWIFRLPICAMTVRKGAIPISPRDNGSSDLSVLCWSFEFALPFFR
jgi:hypothetical protein